MAKQDLIPTVGYEPTQDNSYNLNHKSKATPYFLSYLAATNERPIYEDPVDPIIVDRRPQPKRLAFTILIVLMMAVLLAAFALSFLGIVPDYTGLFVKADATAETGMVNVGVDDIIYGSISKVFSIETEFDSVFYNDCLKDIEYAETAQKVAFYALPVSVIISALVALYLLIKGIVACATIKRRKFAYMALILILFTLIGVVAGLIWNGAEELNLENIIAFFIGRFAEVEGASVNISLGIGFYIILGVEIINLIFSGCAYRSKKVSKF